MELGTFSVSLAVKDIEASKVFYEKIGFSVFMGDQSQNWLIMKNDKTTIGLFQGMFDKNMFTFNPGWNSNAQPLKEFTDIRELQRQLKDQGVSIISEADASSSGPANFMKGALCFSGGGKTAPVHARVDFVSATESKEHTETIWVFVFLGIVFGFDDFHAMSGMFI